jgi:hypothetical protein
MQDLILLLRLKILEKDAETLLDGLQKLIDEVQKFGGGRARLLVEQKLKNRAFKLMNSIKGLRNKLPNLEVSAAWMEYLHIREDLTNINYEVLEIVGGLAIRGVNVVNVEETLCWIVERFLAGIPVDPPGFTVFSARDTNSPTLARLMRVRFPVKNVWALPMTAHQFATFVIEDTPELIALAKDLAVKEVQSIQPALDGGDLRSKLLLRRAEKNAVSRWAQLMADGVAVYFTGPCYAGSAILLRLNPSTVEPEEDSQAPEYERAFIILEMLRRMEPPQAVKKEGPYEGFANWLESSWKNILAAEENPDLPNQNRRNELQEFVKALVDLLNENLSYAKYPADLVPFSQNAGSWSTAQQWANDWTVSLRQETELVVPKNVDFNSNVRDAFNAGWLCWSKLESEAAENEKPESSESVDQLAEAVFALSRHIVQLFDDQESQLAGMTGPRRSRGRGTGT